MINILFEGYKYNLGIYELIRLFFPYDEQKEIFNYENYRQGYLLNFSIKRIEDKNYGIAKIYLDNVMIIEYIKDLDAVFIMRNEEKTLRVGVKECIYEALSKYMKKAMPWGILTDIRPIKIVHELLNKNILTKDINEILQNEYKLSDENSKLIISIARGQLGYLNSLDKNSYSLYVGIPFCPTRCSYCSFPSFTTQKYGHLIDDYVNNLINEIKFIKQIMEGKSINTVYIGGGTPTALPLSKLEDIIRTINELYGNENINEFTVEAGRPDTINEKILNMFNSNNVNRISINPQTMNEETLKRIGREHSPKDIINSYILAKDIGIEIINMDLIVGLPGEGINEIRNTLEAIETLDPENLTVHTLSIKKGSKLANNSMVERLSKDDNIEDMIITTKYKASKMNLFPYYLYRQKHIIGNFENIGYAKKGYECKYNISMMEEKETILAAGVGSVSKIYNHQENTIKRIPNFRDLYEYNNRIDELLMNKKKLIFENSY